MRPRAFPERLCIMIKKGWNLNTEVCVDLKTQLRSDSRMKAGKGFTVEKYALGVYNELCTALFGLVEEE